MTSLCTEECVFGFVKEPCQLTYLLENLGKVDVQTLNAGEKFHHKADHGTVFVLVMEGPIHIWDEEGTRCALHQGGYAELNVTCLIESQGSALLIHTYYYQGIYRAGFEMPEKGVLRFIDGCTDTLLLSPLIKGNPCLNFLHIPPYTTQKLHTHPSARIGLVISGQGVCVVENQTYDLIPHRFFVVQDDMIHQFLTRDNELRMFVFHPDSDFGPSNEEHPMINKSLIEGVSVTELRKTIEI